MHWLGMARPAPLEFGDIMLYPAQYGRVGNGDPPLSHHLDEISIAESVREVPAHTEFDDFWLKSAMSINWIALHGFGHWAFSQKAEFYAFPAMHQNPKMAPLEGGCQ
jgi:hypothetical protein